MIRTYIIQENYSNNERKEAPANIRKQSRERKVKAQQTTRQRPEKGKCKGREKGMKKRQGLDNKH